MGASLCCLQQKHSFFSKTARKCSLDSDETQWIDTTPRSDSVIRADTTSTDTNPCTISSERLYRCITPSQYSWSKCDVSSTCNYPQKNHLESRVIYGSRTLTPILEENSPSSLNNSRYTTSTRSSSFRGHTISHDSIEEYPLNAHPSVLMKNYHQFIQESYRL